MTTGTIGKSTYSKLVLTLINKIYDNTSAGASFYEKAKQYFLEAQAQEDEKAKLDQAVCLFETREKQASQNDLAFVTRSKEQAKADKLRYQKSLDEKSLERFHELKAICLDIIALTRGSTEEETRILSAKLLGTIQLLSPTEGRACAISNQKSKHLYKAVLALLLLDKLLIDGQINHPYILERYHLSSSKTASLIDLTAFRDDVQIPLLMAVLLQDIGSMHPSAQLILKGSDGKADEFRVLEDDARIELLQTSFKESLKFVVNGLGTDKYVGNSKEERDEFDKQQQKRQSFLISLLKAAVKPESGIGNLLKIPQIYCSVVLSTKSNYTYEMLPKVVLVLEKGVEKGIYSKVAVDALIAITGIYPQGFGITYIPKDSDRQDLDRYEYAIVTGLYPNDIRMPICRMVTRNLTYNVSAQGCVVSVENNLYNAQARKKLERISEERLLEILSKLVSNFEERKKMSLLPKCWRPDEYFSYVKNQNLWNKVVMYAN